MVRVLRYPRLSPLVCLSAFAAAIGRDVCISREYHAAGDVLLTLTLILLAMGMCLLSCRFTADASGVGVGFLFSVRRTAWKDLHSLGTLCCNSRRMYLYGLYKSSPDFIHMIHRAPRCGSWGFVVPMSKRLAAGIGVYCPQEIDLYTGVRRRRERGMHPVWHHAVMQSLSCFAVAAMTTLSASLLIARALRETTFSSCALLTCGAAGLMYCALFMLYRVYVCLQTCPHISENGVSSGRGLYMTWDEIRFAYVHRMAQVSGLFLLSAPLSEIGAAGAPPVRCLSMPDTSTIVLAYLTYCPHASHNMEA